MGPSCDKKGIRCFIEDASTSIAGFHERRKGLPVCQLRRTWRVENFTIIEILFPIIAATDENCLPGGAVAGREESSSLQHVLADFKPMALPGLAFRKEPKHLTRTDASFRAASENVDVA